MELSFLFVFYVFSNFYTITIQYTVQKDLDISTTLGRSLFELLYNMSRDDNTVFFKSCFMLSGYKWYERISI